MAKHALDAAALAFLLLTSAVRAEPLALDGDAAVEKLAGLAIGNEGVASLHWVVASESPDDRARVLKKLAIAFGPDHGILLERLRGEGAETSTRAIGGATAARPKSGVVAYAEAVPPAVSRCSWTMTVSDPALPSASGAALDVPVQKDETMRVSAAARFEIGTSGPLQSTLYAFGETAPGAIRDLAAAPEYAIPVDTSDETVILVRARRPIPFLDAIKASLADKPGARAELGDSAALAARFSGKSRGIGALIQLVDPNMVVADASTPGKPATEPKPAAPKTALPDSGDMTASGDLLETCIYRLSASLEM